MTLPVSSYEELLARVRSLTSETIQLRREITSSLSDPSVLGSGALSADNDYDYHIKNHAAILQRTPLTGEDLNVENVSDSKLPLEKNLRQTLILSKKENEVDNESKEIDEKLISPDTPVKENYFQRNGWTPDACLWRSGPSSLNLNQPWNNYVPQKDLTSSVTYTSTEPQSLNTFLSSSKRIYSHQNLGVKVEMVYSLLSMLDMNNREDMSKTFLAMSSSVESCHAMRQSGCLPLLIQLIHSSELDKEVRGRAAEALHNIVHSQTDEKRRKREIRVLKLLQQVREFCEDLKNTSSPDITQSQEPEKHPINAIGTLMKFSFDAEHRQAICILGGLHAISELIQVDYEAHGNTGGDTFCITLRRYAGMSLTNLTFGDCKNKALLCSFNKFMWALVSQLKSPCEDLRQVTASVLRNLSWRADSESKEALRDVGTVTSLTVSAMEAKKESTLKSILSALWNLSAHCSLNKIDICSVPGALEFLVKMLKYKSSSNTLAIVENAGGILRNISSHIAVREDYRQILRENNCFEILLEQLKSPSLTIVSNACGTLWNLSARCPEDQRKLWEMGATTMLRSLVQSKHKMISMGSSAALKNLLAANPNENLLTHLDSTAKSLGLQNLPTLFVRKKRALEQELNITLAETCENLDSVESPTHFNLSHGETEGKKGNSPRRSESRDSVKSTQSDSTVERLNQIALKNEEILSESKNVTLHDSLDEKSMPRKIEDQKLMRRYKSSMIPTPTLKKVNQDRVNAKTREEFSGEDSAQETDIKTNFKPTESLEFREKNRQRIPVLSSRQKCINDQCISFRKFSLKGDYLTKNTEYEEGVENVGNSHPVAHSGLNSYPWEKRSSLGSNDSLEMKEFSENAEEHEKIVKNESEFKSLRDLSDHVVYNNTGSSTIMIDEKTNDSFERISKTAYSNYFSRECGEEVIENETARCNPSGDDFPERSSHKQLTVDVDFISRNCASYDCQQSSLNEVLPTVQSKFSKFREPSKANLIEMSFSYLMDTQSCQRHPRSEEESELHDISLHNNIKGNISNDTGRETSDILSADHLLPSFRSGSSPAVELEDAGKRVSGYKQSETDRLSSTDFFPKDSNEKEATQLRPASTQNACIPICDSHLAVVNEDVINLKAGGSGSGVLPKFKVGSLITDSKALQMEANKICREIKKHQDHEMGCSLTSEVSLVSSSSFLDTGDFSIFDSSADAFDLHDTEYLDFTKVSSKLKSFSLRKSAAYQAEPISLPSLDSLKNEHIEGLDLDSSIVSVASITSEVADTYSKDFDGFNTFTKTYKVELPHEFLEDTAEDVTLISNDDDDTLNADSLPNNLDLFEEDNSVLAQENMPLDGENLEEPLTDQMKKKLTPKERRKTFHERYKTYTIRDFNVCRSSRTTSNVNSEDLNPNSRESNENDIRQKFENDKVDANGGKEKVKPFSKNFRAGCALEIFSRSKNNEKDEDTSQGFIEDPNSFNDILSIGPAERKELVDNAKLVAFSLKTAVHDCDVISDSDIEEPLIEIDTATYSKSYQSDRFSSEVVKHFQHEEESFEENEDPQEKGARISKSNEKFLGKQEELSKGVRGRRKPLYTSPKKHMQRTDAFPSNLVKGSPVTADAKKPTPDISMLPILRREGTFTKQGSPAKKNEVKNARSIPVLLRNMEAKNSPGPGGKNKVGLSGSFNRVGENQASKIARPPSCHTSKSNDRRPESDVSQRRPFSAEAPSRAGGDSGATSKRPASTAITPPKIRNSSSSQNIRTGSVIKSKNAALQSFKSQSDASLNLVACKDKGSAMKQKTPKKEVTSKIANLWRKVEETKQKNKVFKDDRIWISSDKRATKPGEELLVVETEEVLVIPTRNIVHSFTCQTLTNEPSTGIKSQVKNTKNYNELSKLEGSEAKEDKFERRNILSAVVTPYNYSPPVSEEAQIGTFDKGSLKITTVQL